MPEGQGIIRVPNNQRCPKCNGVFKRVIVKGASGIAYRCPDCLTFPDRYYLDVHHKGERIRVFSDKQGKPLDAFQRAVDLLSHINYEIENHIFDFSKYKKSEQKEFYVCTKLDEYLDHKIDSLAPSYQADFRRYVGIAKDFFKTTDVREIKKIDVINYQKYLKESFNIGNKTIKNNIDVFKAFLNYLKNDLEIISIVPRFPDIDIDIKPFKLLTQEVQVKAYELWPDTDKPIFAFLMLHGCRPSEARALKCKNIDLQNHTITICATFSGHVYREKRKGKKARFVTVPIHPELYGFIVERVKNNLPEAFVFINPNTGKHYCENSLRIIWATVRKSTGLDNSVRLYDATRHSFASNLVNSGSSIYKVSKLLGHSSVKMTEKYAHSEIESLRVDIEKLSLNCHPTVIKKVSGDKK